jgi:nuclear cap-binding protein subunit 2
MAGKMYDFMTKKSDYFDYKSGLTFKEYAKRLDESSILYVGNLAISTPEVKIYQVFSRCGKVRKVNMGTNKKGEAAGFCFVIYETHAEAVLALETLNRTK